MNEQVNPRELGTLRGKIWIASDFDEPDEDLIDLMENGPILSGEVDWLRG